MYSFVACKPKERGVLYWSAYIKPRHQLFESESLHETVQLKHTILHELFLDEWNRNSLLNKYDSHKIHLYFPSSIECVELAEKNADLTMVSKSNTMRRRANEKQEELSSINNELEKLKSS